MSAATRPGCYEIPSWALARLGVPRVQADAKADALMTLLIARTRLRSEEYLGRDARAEIAAKLDDVVRAFDVAGGVASDTGSEATEHASSTSSHPRPA